MPEIPELEAFKLYITINCLDKPIKRIKITDSSVIKKISAESFKKNLLGHEFVSAQRIGKYLIINLSNSNKKLVMHFALTGSLFYTKKINLDVKFSKVQFIFKNSVLHWISIRKFEKLWLVDDLNEITGLKKLGTDALKITQKEFLDLLEKNKTKNIKAFLMDQTKISGIGNEYSDEALFQAGIDPHHHIKDLPEKIRKKLYTHLNKILDYSIKIQAKSTKKATGPNFLSKENRTSFASSYLQAHRHIDMICPKNKKHTLLKTTIGGRTCYYCPEDQK